MKNLISNRSIWLILAIFVFSMIGSALQAATKQEMYEVGKEIRDLKATIKDAYEELRKLNEEGGPGTQIQAQMLMQEIREMKQDLRTLKAVLDNMKNDVR